MLRPERMSRVSVTGAKRVMDEVVETMYDLNLLHVTDYDGGWEGFDPGSPVAGADEASDKLVTVRSLQSILDVDPEDVDREEARVVTDEGLERDLPEVRDRVNERDEHRDDLEDELRTVEERIETMRPLQELGIDLDLLQGYDRLAVRVGEGDPEAVREALADAEAVEASRVFAEGRSIAVFAYPAETTEDEDVLEDVLVGIEFTPSTVPEVDAESSPDRFVRDLEDRRNELNRQIESAEGDLADLRDEYAEFLVAAEEALAIEVQKREAPLSFATTEGAFVAEGWIPSDRYDDLDAALDASVGDHADLEHLEEASYDEHGHPEGTEGGDAESPPPPEDRHEDASGPGAHEAVTDGGHAADRPIGTSSPPVVQDNPGPVEPFETLVKVVSRPKYTELDPTIVLFATFPLFFGFMIGDLGYGLLYTALGAAIWATQDSDALRSLGIIAVWAGVATMLFGVLYGEVFGLHVLGEVLFGTEEHAGLLLDLGHAPLDKGLSPGAVAYAKLWIVVSALVGLVHVSVGYLFDFVETLDHGLTDAVLESGSWIVLMLGIWVWIFSEIGRETKPEFIFTAFNGEPIPLGFAGFSETVGWVALALALGVGLTLMVAGEVLELGAGAGIFAGVLESLNVLVNVLSYARIAAVLLAKAGMAFTVNLLFFGAYQHDGEFHFLMDHGPDYVLSEYGQEALMFPGLENMGTAGVAFGVLVLLVGHMLVLALGVTSAGLQAVRLEYVEFMSKFYEGGGEEYRPFGYDRTYTAEE